MFLKDTSTTELQAFGWGAPKSYWATNVAMQIRPGWIVHQALFCRATMHLVWRALK